MQKRYFLSSIVALSLLGEFWLNASESVKLEGVEINSVGDNVSNSGIDEGFLTKNIQHGILAGKKAINTPYQINTISKEIMNNQGVTGYEEAVKYFPSAQIQMRGGTTVGRPQTRGFEGSVVGNSFWDGFYTISTTAIPMAMFESFQVQNGIAGSLYGAQNPVGIFSYTRKRPIENQHTFWGDYISLGNFGLGIDSSMKFEKFGYRAVFYGSDGAKQVKDSNHQRRLASIVLEFYPTDELTLETAASYYEHNSNGFAGQVALGVTKGKLTNGLYVPSAVDSSKQGLGQRFGGMSLKTTTASLKAKYAPNDNWYFEGGFQFQRADRDIHSVVNYLIPRGGFYPTDNNGKPTKSSVYYKKDGDYVTNHSGGASAAYRFDLPSGYLKATTNFDTLGLNHDFAIQANGYRYVQYRYKNLTTSDWIGGGNLYNPIVYSDSKAKSGSDLYKLSTTDMKNISILDDITINDKFEVMLSLSNAWIKERARDAITAKDKILKPIKTKYDKNGISLATSLIYHPTSDVSLYFTYADSLQQGGYGANKDGSVTILSPYRSKQYEIGAKARLGEVDLSTALFRISRPIAYLSSSTGIYGVQGEQINKGLELMVGGKLTSNLSTLAGVTVIDAKMHNTQLTQANNKYANGVPKVNTNILFDYIVPNTNQLAFSTNFHYTSKMYVDDLNTASIPSFFVTDVGVRYTSKSLLGKKTILRFNVNNLFNKKYWAGMYPASADGNGGINPKSVLGAANGLTLGESRTFMLSAEVKF
jgi:tonB-dependent receptor domain protein